MNDWRITNQATYLEGVKLMRLKYANRTTNTDHDHCEFCMERFSENPRDLHEGYCTLDCYYWICDECFNDFKDDFKWHIIGGSEYQCYQNDVVKLSDGSGNAVIEYTQLNIKQIFDYAGW